MASQMGDGAQWSELERAPAPSGAFNRVQLASEARAATEAKEAIGRKRFLEELWKPPGPVLQQEEYFTLLPGIKKNLLFKMCSALGP